MSSGADEAGVSGGPPAGGLVLGGPPSGGLVPGDAVVGGLRGGGPLVSASGVDDAFVGGGDDGPSGEESECTGETVSRRLATQKLSQCERNRTCFI